MYTYDQAQQALKEHQYLIGSQIRTGWRIKGIVEGIIIAPFDGINQYRFLKEYKSTGNALKALKFYKGVLHTVLLVIRSRQCTTDLYTIDLERYHSDIAQMQSRKALALEA
jgi:hypothetical protein